MEIKEAMEYELRMAHQIINNALFLMTTAQINNLACMNEADGVDGEGATRATRANERMAVLSRLMDGE